MIEEEWLTTDEVQAMLRHVAARLSTRKCWLFSIACCRQMWNKLPLWGKKLVNVLERRTDGRATKTEMAKAKKAVQILKQSDYVFATDDYYGVQAAKLLVVQINRVTPVSLNTLCIQCRYADRSIEQKQQANLLREIVGNPFHLPPIIEPSWLKWNNGLIRSMSETAYDNRNYSDLPILADALEDAGCSDERLLLHLRSDVQHTRGCWVLDLLLEK